MPPLPTGTVTLLFTDIEDSTPLLQQLGDAMYATVLAEHARILREACAAHGGHEVESHGDGILVAFREAGDAALAATAAQRGVWAYRWPDGITLRVRIGLHTGEPIATPRGYVGLDVHRAARICQAGWGGQILLTEDTHARIASHLPSDLTVRHLGAYRLKGLHRPEHVFQLLHPDLPEDFPPVRSLDSLPNNLPRLLTSFIGRDREMDEIKRLLSEHRLVTLTGAGGCGKTRLALQVAADRADTYRDGVWLVELAALSDPALVPQALASVLHVREQQGRTLLTTLTEHLASRELLAVLDNCEHVIRACAHLTEALLHSTRALTILTTSREPLGIPGERTYRIPSLSLPDLDRMPTLDRLSEFDAVRLFIDRAAATSPSFRVTRDTAPLVAHICHRLDGIPLAIELAAARVKVLTLNEIALRLNDRFRLLSAGSRTAIPRQQTLRAAMDWSYALLSEGERLLAGRLSVFAGGWTLDAAETICAGDGIDESEVLDLLTQLVDKSLVVTDESPGGARFHMLETVRQYSRDRLLETRQDQVIRTRHRDWVLAVAEQAEAGLRGPAQAEWLARIEIEHDNIRAALEWCLAHPAAAEAGMRLAAAMGRFWWMRGHLSEARRWLEGLLTIPGDSSSESRARTLLEAGRVAFTQSDYAAAGRYFEQSLTAFRMLEDRSGIVDSLNMLGLLSWVTSEYGTARMHFQAGLPLARALDDLRRVTVLLSNLGLVEAAQGDYDAATSRHQESLEILRSLGDTHGVAIALNNLGLVAAAQGRWAAAQQLFEESLRIRRDLDDRHHQMYSLNNLAAVNLRHGDDQRAGALVEESLALARAFGDQEGVANALLTQARIAQHRGDLPGATAHAGDSLRLRHALRDRRGVAECFELLAAAAAAQGRHERAGRLIGAASALRDTIGAPHTPVERQEHARVTAAIRTHLGARASTILDEGRRMSLEGAVDLATSPVA
jgi:predicted ATPase/class 3 adenylate cyclase